MGMNIESQSSPQSGGGWLLLFRYRETKRDQIGDMRFIERSETDEQAFFDIIGCGTFGAHFGCVSANPHVNSCPNICTNGYTYIDQHAHIYTDQHGYTHTDWHGYSYTDQYSYIYADEYNYTDQYSYIYANQHSYT